MKKTIIYLSLLIIVAGCSNSQQPEKNMTNENLTSSKPASTPVSQGAIDPKSFEELSSQYSQAIIETSLGDITVKFYNQDSSNTVNNFLNLVKLGFYDGTKFHRVIKDFMIQGGDPNSKDDDWSNDGIGGPGYRFSDEFNDHKLVRGSLAMANAGPDTNGSQFFIVTAESTPWLDGKHTNFGQVISDLNIIDKIEGVKVNESDHPTEDIVIKSIELLK
jgi:peptidyl-prolyl cis-trans isomerase B (cyclophilin B)